MSSRFDIRALRSRDELTAVGKDLADEIKTDDVPSMAAAVAFKIVIALFPALAAAVGLFTLVTEPADLQRLLASLTGVVPSGVTEFLRDPLNRLIDNRSAGGIALVVGVVGGLWAASSAAVTLNKSLTRAYDQVEDRKLVKMRGSALAVTFALLAALVAIFVLLIVGGRIENSVLEALPLTEQARTVVDVASTAARYVLAALVAMLFFAFIYWIGPDFEQRPKWAWITPGAVVGVLTFLIASALFGVYTSWSGTYTGPNSIYGSLGSAILFMLWLQITMLALLLGAEVNQVLQVRARRRSPSIEPAEAAGAAAGAGTARASDAPSRRRPTAPAPGRAVTVLEHDRAPTPATPTARQRAPEHEPGPAAAQLRRVPAATVVGAGVAAASSLIGVVGLLRRLKGA